MTIMIGIDPHKATHTAFAIDNNEVVLDEYTLRASKVQARRLCEWARRFEEREWAVESANGLEQPSAAQCQHLRAVSPARLNRTLGNVGPLASS